MDVRLAGSGPAAESIRAALSDLDDGTPAAVDPGQIGGANLGIVVGGVGDERFVEANRSAGDADTAWIGVEIGGVGGHAVAGVEAAVAGFGAGAGCYECLRSRVAANDPEIGSEETTPPEARLAGAVAGREAVKLLFGENSRLLSATPAGARIGGVLELPHVERTVLPVPGCRCDPGRDRTLDLSYREVDIETSLDRAELGLDRRVGVVREVGEVASFPAPYYLATLSDTGEFSDATAAQKAAAVDADWNTAFMKALGESMERYCAGVYREGEFLQAPVGALDGAVSPARFVRPDDAPDPEGDLPWVQGIDLATGDAAALPAETVHFPPPEERFTRSITTGLGLGNSTVEATLSGLYEVVERDATMIAWYSTFEPLELAVDDETFRSLANRARSEDLSVTALLVTLDVDVPVVTVAVHREGEWPRFAVGANADLDPVSAARGALTEAVQNWMELRTMGREAASEEPTAIAEYADLPERARRFLDAGGPIPAGSVGPEDPPAGEAELDALVDRVTAAGLDAYAARITPRDVAAMGFEAVRVVSPTAQPLFTRDPFFGERAREVPTDLGFEADLGKSFHPYP